MKLLTCVGKIELATFPSDANAERPENDFMTENFPNIIKSYTETHQ